VSEDLQTVTEEMEELEAIGSGFDEVKSRAPWSEAAGEDKLGKGGPESVRFQAVRVAYSLSCRPRVPSTPPTGNACPIRSETKSRR
jgi:hypothetical protein